MTAGGTAAGTGGDTKGSSATGGGTKGGSTSGGETATEGTTQGSAGSSGGVATDTAGGTTGSDPVEVKPCAKATPGLDFTVCAATYVGGAADDVAGSVAIAPDGSVVYVGSLAGDDLGQTAVELEGGGDGVVVRFSPDGRAVRSLTRLGEMVADVAVARSTGTIAVVGGFGVAALSPDASELLWKKPLEGASKVAAGNDGTIAALGKGALVVGDDGKELGRFGVGSGNLNDLALDAVSESVFVVGFKQDDGGGCTQLQIPFIRTFDYMGGARWKGYDWTHAEVAAVNECADSRGIALAIGEDGKLYYAGESHGGNTVHHRMPDDLSTQAPNVKSDPYNDSYNMNGAAPITYFARLDAKTGALEKGGKLLTRLPNTKGNALRPRAIGADAAGNVTLVGASACCIEKGAERTVRGERAMSDAYLGGGFIAVIAPDFTTRLSWTTLRGLTGGSETPIAVYVGSPHTAVVFDQTLKEGSTKDQPMLTFDAPQAMPGGGLRDGYLVVFPNE